MTTRMRFFGTCAMAAVLLAVLLPLTAPPAEAMSTGEIVVTYGGVTTGEGNAVTNAAFRRQGGTFGAITVTVRTADGTAVAGDDYLPIDTTITWADGETGTKQVDITLLDDALVEPDETFSATVTASTPGVIGTSDTVNFTIKDDDGAGTINFESAVVSIAEGSFGPNGITLSRRSGSVGAIDVMIETSDATAEAGTDYISVSTTVSWADGETSDKFVPISILNDSTGELDETFHVTMTAADPSVLGNLSTISVKILDDDGLGTIEFNTSVSSKVNESTSSINLWVVRSDGFSGPATVTVTSTDETATAGSDYSAFDQTFTWADGETGSKTITVPILDDALVEPPETFLLTISSANPALLGPESQRTVTILDDEAAALPPAMCNGQTVTINMFLGDSGFGTNGPDVILGTPGDDVIDGIGGDDTICAGDGNDTIDGGDGNDTIFGEMGVDIIVGGTGNDLLHGGDGNDRIRGQQDNDTIEGNAGNDFLYGGTGDDTIHGNLGNDTIGGFGGVDMIFGGQGDDKVFGGFGADVIQGGGGNDVIRGLVGNDTIHGNDGDDKLYGDNGQDELFGDNGNDMLFGGNSDDTANGGPGNDEVNGGKASDTLSGGPDVDVCRGNLGTDTATSSCETITSVP